MRAATAKGGARVAMVTLLAVATSCAPATRPREAGPWQGEQVAGSDDSAAGSGEVSAVSESDSHAGYIPTSQPTLWRSDAHLAGPEDLARLAGYRRVAGDLLVEGTDLENLDGLQSLERVDGFVIIRENNALTSLAGLDGLAEVGADLIVERNPRLIDLDALAALTRVGGLSLRANRALTSIAGLRGLDQIGWSLEVRSNFALASLGGLEQVERLGGGLYLGFDHALQGLEGLGGLRSVGSLVIEHMEGLQSARGLANLGLIRDSLEITYNPQLPACEVRRLGALLDADDTEAARHVFHNGPEGESHCDEVPLWTHPDGDVTEPDAPSLLSAPPGPGDEPRPYPGVWLEEARRRHRSDDCQHLVYEDGCDSVRRGVVELSLHLDDGGRVRDVRPVRNTIHNDPELVYECLEALVRPWRFRPPAGYAPIVPFVVLFSDMC